MGDDTPSCTAFLPCLSTPLRVYWAAFCFCVSGCRRSVFVRRLHWRNSCINRQIGWKPLRRVLPGVAGYDWASLAGAFLIALLSMAVDLWIMSALSVQGMLLLALMRLCQWVLYGFMGLILIEVVFSWVNPHAPLAPCIRALSDPLMRPLRKFIPPLGGIDLS